MMSCCPWDSWRQAPLEFCEAALCAWIKQPADTFSNVGFLLVGAWIWRRATRDGRPHLRTIGAIAIVTGLGSAFYHASGTYWGALADYAGMFMTSSLMIALNMRRWRLWSWGWVYLVFAATTLLFVVPMIAFPGSERWVYALGSPCWLIEIRLFVRDRHETRYGAYLASFLVVGIAALFWWLDIARILCNPNNHILTGHSVWHLLLASAFLLFYRFYAQFPCLHDERSAGNPPQANTSSPD